MESKKAKNAIWIDKKINSEKINSIFQELKFALLEFNIYKCKSVSEAFILIKKEYNKFQFKLIYIIVGEELCEKFIKEYMEKSLTLNLLATTVIFSNKENNKELENKPFFADPFLNHGKVVNSLDSLINYIMSIQCPFYLLDGDNIHNQEELKVRNRKISKILYKIIS